MKLVIYSSNFSPELTGIGKFNGELANELVERNIQTFVLTAPPYYPEWRRHESYRNRWTKEVIEDGFIVYRSPMYIPGKVTFIKRILHLASFAMSSIPNLIRLLLSRPDVILVVQPTLFCAPAALIFSRLTGAKAIMHIQDFELDAMLGLGMSNGCKRWAIFKKVETFIMRRFDLVSTISYKMMEKAREKGVVDDRLVYFPNWADTAKVNPKINGTRFRQDWGVANDEKLVLYAGNIGNKQGLELVLEAAEVLQPDCKVRFFIVGDGTNLDNLQSLKSEKGLDNLEFKPLQPLDSLPEMLAAADIHLVVQKKGAADSVLPSKLTGILAAGGHALVTAEDQTELGQLSRLYPGIFEVVDPENLELFLAKLRSLLEKDTSQTNVVARNYALENLTVGRVIDRFLKRLDPKIQAAQTQTQTIQTLERKNNVE